jgi:hypothetical protein
MIGKTATGLDHIGGGRHFEGRRWAGNSGGWSGWLRSG